MANEYTSIATAGIATQLVAAALDLQVREELRHMPTSRIAVTVRPARPAHTGSSITITKTNWLADATVTAAMTPLTEESDVDSVKLPAASQVTITPHEYGGAITRTKLIGARAWTAIDPIVTKTVADWMNRVIDQLVQAELQNTTAVTYGGSGNSGVNDLAAGDNMTSDIVRRRVVTMRGAGVAPWAGNSYLALVRPEVVLDLREETGASGWRFPRDYTNAPELKTGEFGEWEGVRFVENFLLNSGTNSVPVDYFNTYFLGQGGLAEHVVEEPHTVVGPPTDKLNRFWTFGWYGDFGHKIYENAAVQRVITTADVGDVNSLAG